MNTTINADRRLILLSAALLALLVCSPTRAASIALDPVRTGQISHYVEEDPYCSPPFCSGPAIDRYTHQGELGYVEYDVSLDYYCGISCASRWPDLDLWTNETRGYLVFNLSGAGSAFTSASLEIDFGDNGYSQVDLTGLDTMTAGAVYNLSNSSTKAKLTNAFQDVGSGTGYASVYAPDDGLYSATLNASALDTINSTSGLFVIGVTYTGLTGSYANIGDVSLVLDDTVPAVPLPAAAWLFGSAVLGLGVVRRRSRR